jgi:tripartite-type tricarboxylate transporter receptor subunit TctC
MTSHPNRRQVLAAGVLGATAGLPLPGWSQQEWPARPIHFVVPYVAGGGTADVFARTMAQKLTEALGQQVVVENRPGANGNIGSDYVAKQPPQGYALLLGTTSTIAMNPHLYPKMPYDPLRDLAPLALTHTMPNVLVVNPATPYKTVADVVAAAKAKPDALAYASAGKGNSMHLSGELFELLTGAKLVHVPYQGGPPALNDVLGGQVPMMFNNLPAVVPMIKSGRLRALMVTSPKRSPLLPDVPSATDVGMPNLDVQVWTGIFARAGSPAPVLQRLSTEIQKVLAQPELRNTLQSQGFEVVNAGAEQFAQTIKADYDRWGRIIKQANIVLE